MYDDRLYAQGIRSLLIVEWQLKCETPLVIRNGKSIRYSEHNDHKKERGGNLCFQWKPSTEESGANAVAALCYGYQVEGEALKLVHQVPASSVRGALRSWTIRHLVASEFQSCLLPPSEDDAEKASTRMDLVRRGLADRSSGLAQLASVFGMALETPEDGEDWSNAGRLTVETRPFDGAPGQSITANGTVIDGMAGPDNARRHMTVRNPLDRITHAAKGTGLHHLLEFARDETFAVSLRMVNPTPSDVGLLSIWSREIDDGMLRLGALSSIGRGRLSVQNLAYSLHWLRGHSPDTKDWPGIAPNADADVLSGLYRSFALGHEHLAEYEAQYDQEGADVAQS